MSRQDAARIGSLFVLLLAAHATADDWPQWRGPLRAGIAPETGWSSTGVPDAVWTAEVGIGYASPSVADGRIFITGHDVDAGRDTLYCFDALTGEKLWSKSNPAKNIDNMHPGGTLTTPVVDGDRVYHLDREGRFRCLDTATGRVRWFKDLAAIDDVEPTPFGFPASPLVLEEMVVLNADRIMAFDKDSGDLLWKTGKYGDPYATPVDVALSGRPALAVFNGVGLVIADRATGRELHRHEWQSQYNVNSATPIAVGDRVFISTGYNDKGCAMLDFSGEEMSVAWQSKRMRNDMNGCVLWQDHLYGFDKKIVRCFDLDGNEKWSERGLGQGTLIVSDGRLIILSGDGELVFAKATPRGYEEISRVKVFDDGNCWTTPVLANGRIYLRNSLGTLVCRDHRGNPVDRN